MSKIAKVGIFIDGGYLDKFCEGKGLGKGLDSRIDYKKLAAKMADGHNLVCRYFYTCPPHSYVGNNQKLSKKQEAESYRYKQFKEYLIREAKYKVQEGYLRPNTMPVVTSRKKIRPHIEIKGKLISFKQEKDRKHRTSIRQGTSPKGMNWLTYEQGGVRLHFSQQEEFSLSAPEEGRRFFEYKGERIYFEQVLKPGQKEVDVQIAVDIVSLVIKEKINRVCLLTGDGDFLPVVKLVESEGQPTILWHGGRNSDICPPSRKLLEKCHEDYSLEDILIDIIKMQ